MTGVVMKLESISRFQCPKCRSLGLEVVDHDFAKSSEILNAGIICAQCGAKFPIIKGIPRFVEADNYSNSFGYQWNIHSKTQLDSSTGFDISRRRVFAVTQWPEKMPGQNILEAGSGAGRFTEILLSTDANVYSFDFSSAVEANGMNNGKALNLNLFQGDIFNIPFTEKTFDKVFCLGVIQHTPDPEKALKSLASQVKPGGELVIDVYTRSFIALLQWKYILRPITRKMNKESLYKVISFWVPLLLPLTILLRKLFGRVGARLMPIVEYSNLGLPYELNKKWSVLDTFDMYSPVHDHPQSIETIKRWYNDVGFENVSVGFGPNGVIAKGMRPLK